ncbi:hypothetical protein IDH44_16030 [Paenibacillus sp. IB182496]|uniref:Ger(X)C family spore germination protein n=1 Tax=Paenibacillus sabuli TaxID=2772509 RepID=A0A927GT45_9BACL|nr:Ger(x)C family spore germination C-terminal domain-containing protein [Paenibacillus sabuli]MBD2846705.1 hypothetical protein [Paenibacillus sabuli]
MSGAGLLRIGKGWALGLLASALVLTIGGCIDMVHLSAESFVVGIGIEQGADGQMAVTVVDIPIVRSDGGGRDSASVSEQQEQLVLVTSRGPSIAYCLRDIQSRFHNRFTLSKLQYVVFGQRAASAGIKPYLDYFNRSSEVDQSVHLFTTRTEPALFLDQTAAKLQQFVMNTYSVDRTYSASMLWQMARLADNPLESGVLNEIGIDPRGHLELVGERLLQRDQLRMAVPKDDSKLYNLLRGEDGNSLIVFADDQRKLAFEVHESRRRIEYRPDEVRLHFRLKLWQLERPESAAHSAHADLERQLAERLAAKLEEMLREGQRLGVDIVGVGEGFRRRGWDVSDWSQRLRRLDLSVEVKAKVLSGQGRTDR